MSLPRERPVQGFRFLVPLALLVWLFAQLPVDERILAVFFAATFAVYESSFRFLTDGYAHTTFEQFYLNVFAAPFYVHFVRELPLTLTLCFPLIVWIVEIVGGYFLTYLWGRRAWIYRGRFAFFDGNITLAYLPIWLGLGAFQAYVVHPRFLQHVLPVLRHNTDAFNAACALFGAIHAARAFSQTPWQFHY